MLNECCWMLPLPREEEPRPSRRPGAPQVLQEALATAPATWEMSDETCEMRMSCGWDEARGGGRRGGRSGMAGCNRRKQKPHSDVGKKRSKTRVFDDFAFRIHVSPQPGAILWITTSKSSPKFPILNDFDFRTALSPQSVADFLERNFKEHAETTSFWWFCLRNTYLASAWCTFCGSQCAKNAQKHSIFNDFDFRIAHSPQPGANFVDRNFKNRSKTPSFCWFCLRNSFLATAWWKFCGSQLQKVLQNSQCLMISPSESLSCQSVVQISVTSSAARPSQTPLFGANFASRPGRKTIEKT